MTDEAQLQELRDKRTTALDAADEITKLAEAEDRSLTEDEETKVTELLAEADTIKAELERSHRTAELKTRLTEARNAYQPPDTQRLTPTPDGQTTPPVERVDVVTPRYEAGDAFGAVVCGRMQFGQNHAEAKEWARRSFGSGSPQFRAMEQSQFTAGGALISENFVGSELIELLRARAAVRRAGARTIPLVGGSATVPKVTGGSTAFWGVEGQDITASEMTTGNITLVEKKLTALVPFSNDLARNASLEVTRLIRDDLADGAANTEDTAFLNGTGLNGQPKGIFEWVGAAGQTASAGTALANVRTDIRTAKNFLGNANAPMRNRAWFIHSRDLNYMGWDLVDGNSNFAFPQLQQGEGANLGGGTVYEDNNIVLTGGAQIFYVEMSECFIGDNGAIEIEVFNNAAYVDANGNLVSGVSRDQSVVRLIRKTDFAMRHIASAHVTTGVTYGA